MFFVCVVAVDDPFPNGKRTGSRYQQLLDEAPEAVMVLDSNLVLRYASRATGDILGLDLRSVAGKPFSTYLHPEDEAWARNPRAASGWGRGAPPTGYVCVT